MRYNPFTDYDKHGCLKLPWLLFATLAFLLKGYVIWVVALSNRQDTGTLLTLFYPNRDDFTMALILALPALWCGLLVSLRRSSMPSFIETLWRRIRFFIGVSALIQLIYVLSIGHLSVHNLKHAMTTYPMLIEIIALVAIIAYSLSNQHLKDVSQQFPRDDK